MKKILLSAFALLAFGIASAQTDPKTPPVAPTPPSPQVTAEEKKAKDANVQNQIPATSEKRKQMDGAQPRKDELKTQDHVKSTPDPNVVKDEPKDKKTAKKQKTKKSS